MTKNQWQMILTSHGTIDRMSEEVYSETYTLPTDAADQFFESDLTDLLENPDLPNFNVAGECDPSALLDCLGISTEPHELDRYLVPDQLAKIPCTVHNPHALILPTFAEGPRKRASVSRQSIPLSQSVGVGQPRNLAKPPQPIEIVHELEETFRPRYKSDYFAQSGKNRKPRYVADRKGNHYVTLKMAPGTKGIIRVDWLTVPTPEGDRFSMPYRFQENNELPQVLDCNPIYLTIDTDGHGMMKLYLVLIKSKQDELKNLQPLKPFHPFQDAFGIPDKNFSKPAGPMVPKQLIQKFQLDKSQLAFTYCTVASDNTTIIPEWNTTVYSSVLTEASPEASRNKTVSCPNCAQSFQVSIPNADDEQEQQQQLEAPMNKQKRKPMCMIPYPRVMKKQRSFTD